MNRQESEKRAQERLFTQERERAKVDPGPSTRHEIALLAPENCVGAEIGVDTGQLSERFIQTGHFSSFHSVDKWDDHAHSERQYWAVAEKLMKYQRSRVWRMSAMRFAQICPKEMFGFIYIDCYAHTGQDRGEVLDHMWPLLQEGGLFGGDDYDEGSWPFTYQSVNEFAERVGRKIQVYDRHLSAESERLVRMDRHPSWYVYK